jgi:hypothetical protein
MYMRYLCLSRRNQVLHTFLLSKLWYCAPVLPITVNHSRQLTTAVLWYNWHGNIFRVPNTTLYRWATGGGMELLDIHAKSVTLFITRPLTQYSATGTITAEWLAKWPRSIRSGNPPKLQIIRKGLDYLRSFFQEWSYIRSPLVGESYDAMKRRVYWTLREYDMALRKPAPMGF